MRKSAISVNPIDLVRHAVLEEARLEDEAILDLPSVAQASRELLQIVAALEKFASGGDDRLETTDGGYLRTRIGGMFVFVPFHLVEYFPFLESEEELLGFAESVRISGSGYICVSGSTAVLKRVGSVGDIDFCEYFEKFEADEGRRLGLCIKNEDGLVCVRVKWAEEPVSVRPWDANLILQYEQGVEANADLANARWKLDFLGLSEKLGPIAVTNMALPQGKPVSGLAIDDRSWIYQEAIFSKNEVEEINLADSSLFGKYLVWLRRQIDEYLNENPLKAAKRALSMSLILSLRDEEALLALGLQDQTLSKKAKREALKEAKRFASFSNDLLPREFVDAIGVAEAQVSDFDEAMAADAQDFCREAALKVANRYDELYEDALLVLAEELDG